MDIDRYMFPESGKLHIVDCIDDALLEYEDVDPTYKRYLMQLVDLELDPFVCEFDECGIRINTEDLEYIYLDRDNLRMLSRTLTKVENLEKNKK